MACCSRQPDAWVWLSVLRGSDRPTLAAEWHPGRNGDRTPRSVTWSSGLDAWWQCRAISSHVWQCRINSRASAGTGCPFCAGLRLSEENSLKARAPEIAREWHAKRNGCLRPDGLVAYSTRSVWWQCAVAPDHEWQATPNQRVSHGTGCPICAGRKVVGSTSLARAMPEVAAEWNNERNGALTPANVTPGSHRRVWWRCARDPSHAWPATVLNRARNGSGCPQCAGRRPRL
jgi:hypothetical protein